MTETTEQTQDLQDAARAFFPDASALTPVPESDRLLRAEAASGVWCVRRWASGTTAARIEFVHALLARLREAGIEIVPAVAPLAPPREGSVLTLRGALYDAESWLPGEPPGQPAVVAGPREEHVNLPVTLPPQALTALAEGLARMHAASEELARGHEVPRARLRDVAEAVGRATRAHRERLGPILPTTPVARRWVQLSRRALPAATELLRARPAIWLGTTVVGNDDLWPAHTLFAPPVEEGRLTGIIDFADAAAGSPLLDLAQLIAHFGPWSDERAEAVLGAYTAIRPLGPDERHLLPAVAALDLTGEAGWLLRLAYFAPDLSSPTLPLLRMAADTLVASLEAALPLVEAGEGNRQRGAGGRGTRRR